MHTSAKPLTAAQERFCVIYGNYGEDGCFPTAKAAYMEAFPRCKVERQAEKRASALLKDTRIRQRVDEERASAKQRFLDRVSEVGIAVKANRIRRYHERSEQIDRLIKARAEALTDRAPGGETGLIYPEQKVIGHGDNAQEVTVYHDSTGLLKEEREILKQVAIEVGDWEEVQQIKTPVKALIGVDINQL